MLQEAFAGVKQFESFVLDTSNQCLWLNGAQLSLPPKPFAVLRYLVENPARLITHDELLDALWPETYVQPQVLRTYMLELRKILGDDAAQPRFIQTLPKRGYRFVAPVADQIEIARNGYSDTATHSTKTTGIVGREEELHHLRAQLDSLTRGQRQVVFVTGEAGIGKTALVDTFCTSCRHANASLKPAIARGQCVEGFGQKEEYYPMMEALGQLWSSQDGEKVCRILTRIAPAWRHALGRATDATTESEANHTGLERVSGQRMPGELCEALEELAAEIPLILVFEDLHWADDSTLHLISALARRRAPAKLMIVATYRLQDVRDMAREHPLKSLKQNLLMAHLCTEIALSPLDKPAVKELMSRELKQQELPQGLGTFVHQYSGGNPLFVIALLEHLIAQRFLVREEIEGIARWERRGPIQEMEACVPAGLAQMIELEIERLSPEEQRLLEGGSLMSVVFPAWAVAAALELDPLAVEEMCDELSQRLYFLERAGHDELPDGTRSSYYVFAHGLYREVMYQRQAAARRARRHIRIAARLGQLFAGREANVAPEMALHYEAGGDWLHAVNCLRIAAQHAQQRHAYAEGRQLLEHALQIAENMSEFERVSVERDIQSELEEMTLAHTASTRASERVTKISRKA
jgi:predicted ATPase